MFCCAADEERSACGWKCFDNYSSEQVDIEALLSVIIMQFGLYRVCTRGVLSLAATSCALVHSINQSISTARGDETASSEASLSNKRRRRKQFVVVGAGVAGKSCIYQLVHSNPRVDKNILLIDSCPDTLKFTKDSNCEVETTSLNVVNLNVEEQTIELSSGEIIEYDKCLLAMGKATGMISPNFITPHCSSKHIVHITASSCRQQLELLKSYVMNNRHVTLLGGSWTSLSIARYIYASYYYINRYIMMILINDTV